jgi:uncharacterized membrane protein YbhN (UPF0104 family)
MRQDGSEAMDDPEEAGAATDARGMRARVGLLFAFAALALVLVLTLPGIGEVRDRLGSARPGWLAAAAVCELVSMLGFVRTLWAAFDRLVPWRRAVVLGFAEQGANVLLPAGGVGGPALGTLVMRRAGVPARFAAERHAVLFLSTSFVSLAALALAGLLVGAGLLPGDVPRAAALAPGAAAAAVLLAAVGFAYRPQPTRSARGRIRRTVARVRRFVHDGARSTAELLRDRDRLLIAGAVGYYAFDVAALDASFHAFGGGGPPLGVFVLAYTLGHAGALIPTPGGVGGTEGGLIGMFAAYGTPLGLATAAVLGYRIFQLGLPAVLGGLCLLRIRNQVLEPAARERVAARFAQAAEARGGR